MNTTPLTPAKRAAILARIAEGQGARVIARAEGVNPKTVWKMRKQFIAATGETPARFVETARLDAARMLLCRGLSLKSVAAEVGLSPAVRFSEAFERRFGIAPRLFRAMHAEF